MADKDSPMQMIATPPKYPNGHQGYATWLPSDIPYNETFENGLQHTLENPPAGRDGLILLDEDSANSPEPGISVRARDIDRNQLPAISFDQLPLPLDDPRRVYTSAIPGLRLTHPGGYLEGGPGLFPEEDVFASDFISHFNISHPAQLREVRAREIQSHFADAKERMRNRREALHHNARIEKEIKTLTDQREMELKIETRMRDEATARRERREKRRMKNAG